MSHLIDESMIGNPDVCVEDVLAVLDALDMDRVAWWASTLAPSTRPRWRPAGTRRSPVKHSGSSAGLTLTERGEHDLKGAPGRRQLLTVSEG